MSRRTAACAGSRRPSAHQPPSVAAPSTASRTDTASRACASWVAVSCGVFMPICTTGAPGRSRAASAWAWASRSASTPSGTDPVRVTTTGSPVARAVSTVSSRQAAASSAACRGVAGGHSRVLANPGSAPSPRPAGTARSLPQHTRHVAHRSRRPAHRARHLGPCARRACAIADLVLDHPPAGPLRLDQQLERVAERSIGHAKPEQKHPPAAQQPRQQQVPGPGVPVTRPASLAPACQRTVRRTREHRRDQKAHDVARSRFESGMDGGAVAGARRSRPSRRLSRCRRRAPDNPPAARPARPPRSGRATQRRSCPRLRR